MTLNSVDYWRIRGTECVVVLINRTKIPTEKLDAIVRFCRPRGVRLWLVTIEFKYERNNGVSGVAYVDFPQKVIIRLPRTYSGETQPYRSRRLLRYAVEKPRWIKIDKKYRGNPRPILSKLRQAYGEGYLEDECFTREEKIVNVVAHELRHLWQKNFRFAERV